MMVMKNFIRNSINSQKVFYRYFRRKGWKRFLKENILESEGSNLTKAQSIALGIFIGISPFWGFHTVLALSLAVFFRLNKFLTFISSQVTYPPLIPLVIFASMMIGDPFVKGKTDFANMEFTMEMVKNNLLQYLIGSVILASFSAIILGTISYLFLNYFSPEKRK